MRFINKRREEERNREMIRTRAREISTLKKEEKWRKKEIQRTEENKRIGANI